MRFPEFSGEWKKERLKDNCIFFSGGTPSSTNKAYYDGDIPFIRSGEIASDSTELFLSELGLNNSSAKIVEEGDLLLALYGATSGQIAISKIKGAINQAILCIRSPYDNVFLKSAWERSVDKILQAYLQGGQGNLSAEIVKSLTFCFPTLQEQHKIGHLIAIVDERIALQNKIIEDLRQLKSALYQQVFSSIEGKLVVLKTVADIIKGKQINGTELSESGHYYVMNGGIVPSGYYDKYNTEANTISISEGGNSCGYVQYNDVPFWSGGHCYTLNPKNDIVLRYIFHYLKYREQDIMALRIGSGLPNIQKKDLEHFQILLPNQENQQYCANIFDSIESKVTIEISLLNSYQLQKQFLLQQMFI